MSDKDDRDGQGADGTKPEPPEDSDAAEKSSAARDSKPDADQKADAARDSKPDADQKADAARDSKPDADQKADAARDSKPDADQKADAEGDSKPDADQKADAEGDSKPDADAESTDDEAAIPKVEAEKIPDRKAAAWGRPLVRLDAAWTKWEVWLCAITILLEVAVLALWVGLRGLSTAADGSSKAGLVFRAASGAVVLGLVAWFALKKQNPTARRAATVGASILGLFLARKWGNVGVDWASNTLNWFQQASSLTLWGGLRGVGTRLTLLLALLGGSLATAAGKHITIDLITRFLRPKQRRPVVIFGWLSTSVIIGAAAWGFFDHVAIDDFDANADMTAGQKISKVASGLGEDFFIVRKQAALDLKSIPHVIKGERYSEYLSGTDWNQWVDENGFAEHYGKEKAEILKVTADMKRSPIIVVPEKGEPRGWLAKSANLIFPIGLLVIALRFVLLSLLAMSGHRSVDTESHGDMNVVPGGKTDKHVTDEPAKENG